MHRAVTLGMVVLCAVVGVVCAQQRSGQAPMGPGGPGMMQMGEMMLSSGREIGFDTERRFSPISDGFALLQTAIN